MRKLRNEQLSIFCEWSEHRFSSELREISKILDLHPEFIALVAADLRKGPQEERRGAHGMTSEQIMRAALLKQQNSWSYETLEYQCEDSIDTRAFLRLDYEESYSKSCLQYNISRISATTWININDGIVRYAASNGLEKGRTVKFDATVIESNIHPPTDSSLLFDCLRVAERILKKIRKKTRKAYYIPLGIKEAKTLLLMIQYGKDHAGRLGPYKALLKAAKALLKMLPAIIVKFSDDKKVKIDMLEAIVSSLPNIIDQAEKRVIKGQSVPPEEKIVSIFEPHTDIVKKGKRATEYGHKVFLTAGISGLVSDCQLVQGNPSDTEFFIDLIERQTEIYGRAPRQTTADGGFSSEDNVYDAKDLGVKDVCFSKAPGIEVEEMVKSRWVFQKLRKLRTGIEGVISVLKRAFGMDRVTWKGVSGFAAYVHSGVVAYNLTLLARLKLA